MTRTSDGLTDGRSLLPPFSSRELLIQPRHPPPPKVSRLILTFLPLLIRERRKVKEEEETGVDVVESAAGNPRALVKNPFESVSKSPKTQSEDPFRHFYLRNWLV